MTIPLLKQVAHKLLFPAIEAVNLCILKFIGLSQRRTMRQLRFSGQDRVLVIAPHPDDETLGCGGAIGLHIESGDDLRLVIVTDGRRSRAGGLDEDVMVELRAHEAMDAADVFNRQRHLPTGNFELYHLGLPEGQWIEGELIEILQRQISEWEPTIIYTTSCVDFHPEHLRVAHSLARALQSLPPAQLHTLKIRAYELQVPLTPDLANVFANIITTQKNKMEALAAYRTQQGSFLWVRRYSRYLRAAFNTRVPIEVFWEMNAQQFTPVHLQGSVAPGFRSIRLRPFTDVLPWVMGKRSRRDLREVANREQFGGECR